MELKNIDPGVSEMAQWSRALATLAGDLGLIPRTHMVASMGTRHIAGAYAFRENRENIKKFRYFGVLYILLLEARGQRQLSSLQSCLLFGISESGSWSSPID